MSAEELAIESVMASDELSEREERLRKEGYVNFRSHVSKILLNYLYSWSDFTLR